MRTILFHIVVLLAFFIGSMGSLSAQHDENVVPIDSSQNKSPKELGMDSLVILPKEKGDITTTVYYSAEDSILVDNTLKKAYLFGKAKIKYDDLNLDAATIVIDWDQNKIFAKGFYDSTKSKYADKPVFRQGQDVYVTDSMFYNIKSKKGIIYGIVTQQGEGYMHGDTAKRTQDAVYMKNGRYTTCNLEHPHFYVNATKIKVIPHDKIVSGPFNMVIEDIPTPLGFILGYFPIMEKKASGIIFPQIGENFSRGVFLQNGGYYWAINDNMGAKLIGDIYSNGSWKVDGNLDYIKRYKYTGRLQLGYTQIKEGYDIHTRAPNNFKIYWDHTSKSRKNSSFNAKVNISSDNYYKQNSYDPAQRQQNVINSTISYRQQFGNSPFSMGLSMRADQNMSSVTATESKGAVYNVTLPDLSLAMNRISPFKRKGSSGNRWYEKIFIAYNGTTAYNLTNQISVVDPTSPTYSSDSIFEINGTNLEQYIFPNGQWSATHSIPITSTFKLFKFLNVNPSFNYVDYWYRREYIWEWDAALKRTVNKGSIYGFNRAFFYNTRIDMSTIMYGTYQFKGDGPLKAIRHTMTPSVGMTYAPDFSEAQYKGYVEIDQDIDYSGNKRRYFRFQGPNTPRGEQGLLTFSLNNVIEGKIRNRKDSTLKDGVQKINLIDNLSISGSYNFLADSLRLSDIIISARTNFFKGLINVFFTSAFDPYDWTYDSIKYINNKQVIYGHRKINKFLADKGKGLLKLYTYNLNIGINLRGKERKKGAEVKYNKLNRDMQSVWNDIYAYPNQYVDFNVPWNLNLQYNLTYAQRGYEDARYIQTIIANGELLITEKWKIGLTTGYNIQEKVITNTNISVYRDLHCWQMNLTVSPFGSYQMFSFGLNAKSSLLQELKIQKRSNNFNF